GAGEGTLSGTEVSAIDLHSDESHPRSKLVLVGEDCAGEQRLRVGRSPLTHGLPSVEDEALRFPSNQRAQTARQRVCKTPLAGCALSIREGADEPSVCRVVSNRSVEPAERCGIPSERGQRNPVVECE